MAGYQERLETLVHYIISKVEPSKLGATKLNKILWFSDLESYTRRGATISGAKSYVRMPNGPMPHNIDAAISKLKRDGHITERRRRVYNYERREFIWNDAPDLACFTAEEIDLINEAINIICDQFTADEISTQSHCGYWEELEIGDEMKIGPGSVFIGDVSEDDIKWAKAIDI